GRPGAPGRTGGQAAARRHEMARPAGHTGTRGRRAQGEGEHGVAPGSGSRGRRHRTRGRGRLMDATDAAAGSADDASACTDARPFTGARWLVEALRAEGVDTLFGYPGGAIMPFYD